MYPNNEDVVKVIEECPLLDIKVYGGLHLWNKGNQQVLKKILSNSE